MTEIGFYHLQRSSLGDALPRLLEKALAASFRVVVLVPDEERMTALDRLLWIYQDESFLPHGTIAQPRAAEQPILLTTGSDVLNGATMAVQTSGSEWGDVTSFTRLLDLFDGNDQAMVASARQRWQRYKATGHSLTYWQQRAQGGWERKG